MITKRNLRNSNNVLLRRLERKVFLDNIKKEKVEKNENFDLKGLIKEKINLNSKEIDGEYGEFFFKEEPIQKDVMGETQKKIVKKEPFKTRLRLMEKRRLFR